MCSPGRILIVDDSEVAIELLAGLLEHRGHTVLIATDAVTALDQVITGRVDVVVCDVHMPQMDGFDLVKHLRGLQADTPIIYTSADDSLTSVLRAMQLHVFAYLPKRGDSIRLLPSVVCQALAHVRALRSNRTLSLELRRANECLEQRVEERTRQLRAAVDELDKRERELRRALVLLEESREQALLNERLAALGMLAAGVAHDVNNPAAYVESNLRTARGHLQELQTVLGVRTEPGEVFNSEPPRASSGVVNPEAVVRHLLAWTDTLVAESLAGMERVVTTVHDITQFSRPHVPIHEVVDLNQVVAVATRLLGNQIRHRARLDLFLADRCYVVGSDSRLVQVLVNLLSNASYAIIDGNAELNSIKVTTEVTATEVVVRVADTGCGIPDEQLDRVREPFFTTRSKSQGTGLGLALCSRVVEDHQGRIEITSKVGVGTCVAVTLPRAQHEPVPTSEAGRSVPPRSLQGLRLLLIDDEEPLLRALRREYKADNEVVVACGGVDAIQILQQDSKFDLVLCDLMMPEMDGPTVFSAIQARWPALARRVVFTTGGAFTERAREFISTVRAPVLTKPVPHHELVQVYRRLAVVPLESSPDRPPSPLQGAPHSQLFLAQRRDGHSSLDRARTLPSATTAPPEKNALRLDIR